MNAKYIVFTDGPMGNEVPIVFPKWLNHIDVARSLRERYGDPVSAGFVRVHTVEVQMGFVRTESVRVEAFGESIPLELKSREIDSRLINTAFRE